MWTTNCLMKLRSVPGVQRDGLDMCMFGLKDPVSKCPMKKGTLLIHNFPKGTLAPVFRRCRFTHAHHQSVEGSAGSYGSRARLAQEYPRALCATLARCFVNALGGAALAVSADHHVFVDSSD